MRPTPLRGWRAPTKTLPGTGRTSSADRHREWLRSGRERSRYDRSKSPPGGSNTCEEGNRPMDPMRRRRFLSTLGQTGALLATGSWLDLIGYAQVSRGPARAFIQPSTGRADFDRRVLGSFLEHLGR